MPTKRRRRLQVRLDMLTPTVRSLLERRQYLDAGGELDFDAFSMARGGARLEAAWRAHGGRVVEDWIHAHPGTRPWAWWCCAAPEPRRVLEGDEVLPPVARSDWFWRGRYGIPPFEPRATVRVESQAAYLDRLGLLGAAERLELAPAAFVDVEVSAWSVPPLQGQRGPSL